MASVSLLLRFPNLLLNQPAGTAGPLSLAEMRVRDGIPLIEGVPPLAMRLTLARGRGVSLPHGGPVFATPQAQALAAVSPSVVLGRVPRVLVGERVPSEAMGLGRVPGCKCAATQDVLSRRDELKMVGIHAAPMQARCPTGAREIARMAEVVDVKVIGDNPTMALVDHDVRLDRPTITPRLPVATPVDPTRPHPASSLLIDDVLIRRQSTAMAVDVPEVLAFPVPDRATVRTLSNLRRLPTPAPAEACGDGILSLHRISHRSDAIPPAALTGSAGDSSAHFTTRGGEK